MSSLRLNAPPWSCCVRPLARRCTWQIEYAEMGPKPSGLAIAASVALLAGCGSSDKSNGKTSSAPATAERPPPPALVGTYTTTLKKSDLPPNPAPELTNHAERWQLRI